jgi:DNA-binding NtrC family response regulator
MTMRVLIVDGDAGSTERLRGLLEPCGHDVRVTPGVRTAQVLAHAWRPDVVLLDLVLPDGDGLTLLRRLRQDAPAPEVVVVSAAATVRSTVAAIEAGAATVLEKPVDATLLLSILARAGEGRVDAQAERPEATELGALETRDPRMRELFDTIRLAAPTTVNVLIQGENGTGKELVAAALHEHSRRNRGPYVKINCAAMPAGLLESELFGHARGAFTGAIAGHKGLFEQADRGSILLDEIAEMPMPLQAKLLRVLQDREFRPVGGTVAIKTDFRLICATNVDAAQAIADGRLRQDLYFRLNTIALQVPALRERAGDVRLLAARFLRRFALSYERALEGVAEPALRLLESYPWPGNVRELEHVIERAVILSTGSRIGPDDLPPAIRLGGQPQSTRDVTVPAGCSLEEVERLAILQTLELTDWNKRQTASILGIHRPTLYNKLRKHRLWRREDRFRHDPVESMS